MKEQTPTERHKDLSLKFLEMGKALTKEGMDNKDFIISSLGNYLTFMSSLVYNEGDVALFNELTNMMNCRSVLTGISNGDITDYDIEQLRNSNEDSIDGENIPDIIKRMKDDYLNSNDEDGIENEDDVD